MMKCEREDSAIEGQEEKKERKNEKREKKKSKGLVREAVLQREQGELEGRNLQDWRPWEGKEHPQMSKS